MNGSNDWKGSIWHHKQVEFGVSQSRLPKVIPTPWRTEHLCGITIKGRWEQDALRPGIGLFLESRTLKKLLIWAQIVVLSDCRTPWLDSHPGP